MKIEAGVAATAELEKAEEEGIELERREKRRLSRVEQVGLDAKQQLIEANLVSSFLSREALRGPRHAVFDLIQEGNLALFAPSRSSTTRRASNSPRMPRGGFARLLRVLSPIRRVPFVFPCTWLKPSISLCASSASCSGARS